MTEPANHHLTITLPDGKTAPGSVVYLQPKAERWRKQTATVHIVTSDWLDPAGYAVVYHTPKKSFAGRYTVLSYGDAEGRWLFKGTFERNE